jgi:hypothetical protein
VVAIIDRAIVVLEHDIDIAAVVVGADIFLIEGNRAVIGVKRALEIADRAVGEAQIEKGGRVVGTVLDGALIILDGAIVLADRLVQVAAQIENSWRFRIDANGFVKVLGGLGVAPFFLLGETSAHVGLGKLLAGDCSGRDDLCARGDRGIALRLVADVPDVGCGRRDRREHHRQQSRDRERRDRS